MARLSPQRVLGALAGVGGAIAIAGLIVESAIAFGLGAFLAAVGVIWLATDHWRGRAHGRELLEFAQQHGWTYAAADASYAGRLRGYPFSQGRERRHRDVLSGDYSGVHCTTLTHQCVDKDNDGNTTGILNYQATFAEIPVRLPTIDILPEGAFDKVALAIGGDDVNVEHAGFNRSYRVRTTDPRTAHAVLHPRFVEKLVHTDLHGHALRIDNGLVILWSEGRSGVEDLAARLAVVASAVRLLPTHLVREFTDKGYGRGEQADLRGPDWATQGGVLNSGRYTGIGVDSDGDGVEDWKQRGDDSSR